MFRLIQSLKKIGPKNLKFFTFISIFSLIIIFTQKNIWFGNQSLADLKNLKKEILTLTEEKIKLESQNKLLEEEKIKLSSGRETIEGLARSELGLIKPGEKFYIFESDLEDERSREAQVN
jgi:cell division protein FtsB